MPLENDETTPDDQPLPVLRRELIGYPQIYGGQPFWVIKDPLALRYYRFNREEYFIVEQLRAGVTLKQLKEAHRQEFKSDRLNNQDIAQFIRTLMARNLLHMTHPQRDELLYQTSKKRRWALIKSQISNYMFFKIPIYDPDKLFDRMIERLRFIWSGGFLIFYLIVLSAAAGLIVYRWHDFREMLNNSFFTLYNLPVLFAAVWLLKALHEFGHGLTCKNYGGEVHELGFLVIVFSPMLYCNITDSWTFGHKGQRMLVATAGMLTEMFVAALAAFVWYFTEPPGFIHTLAFNMVFAGSITTVLFNANPLLKFDGYYILMDLLEVPNLRKRSSDFVGNLFVRYVLGGHPEEMAEEYRYRYVFPLYALAAYVYRWFILFVILFFLYSTLENLHLVWLGRLLAAVSVVTMMVLPLVQGAKMMTTRRRALGISNSRLLVLLAGMVAVVAGVLFWPLEQHVTLNFILEPRQIQWIRADVDGQVSWEPQVAEGCWMEAASAGGKVPARLANPELYLEQHKLKAEMERTELEISRFQQRGDNSQVEKLNEKLQALEKNREVLNTLIANLEVKAPFSGEVLTSNRQMQQFEGQYIPRGTALFLLADTREFVAKIWVPEKTLARLFGKNTAASAEAGSLGQATELMLYSFSKERFHGHVSARGYHREDNMGPSGEKLALSNKVGGEVLTEFDYETNQEKPVEPVYEVTIELDSWPRSARAYMSGRAQVSCGKSTLYQWGKDSLLRFISPEVRL